MNPIVKKDILSVIDEALEIIKKGEVFKLRDLSDHVIHDASVFQDKDSITIAVTIYSLSKIRPFDASKIVPRLNDAAGFLERDMFEDYERQIKALMTDISKTDEKTKFYVEEVFQRAQIKKGSRMFEHGISLGQVAETLGVSMWDMMEYVGQTTISDQIKYNTRIRQKLNYARSLFR